MSWWQSSKKNLRRWRNEREKKKRNEMNTKWFNDYTIFYWFLPYRYHIHTYMSAASFVLSATLHDLQWPSKPRSLPNWTSLLLSISSTYAYIYTHPSIDVYICTYVVYVYKSRGEKKKRGDERTDPFTFIVIDPVCVCMNRRPRFFCSRFFFFRNCLEQTDKRLLSPPLRWMLLTLEEQHLSDSWSST